MSSPAGANPLIRQNLGRDLRWTWLLLVLSAPAVYPAFVWNSGAVAFDAALQHIYRGLVFSGALNEGVLYPRWVQFFQFGLGSPLFTFQAPLPYYALDLLYRLGVSHPIGWRVLIGIGLLAAAMGAYLLVHALTHQKWPAVVAAVAYLYAPYVLRNALERGSNEAYSMFLYPWVLWSVIRLAQNPSTGRFIAAALLWAVCIGCHVLGPLMLAPVVAIVALAAGWRYRSFSPPVALLVGGFLTAFIWAPMLPEQAYVHIERDFSSPDALPWNNPLPFGRLMAAPAVYDVNRETNDTGDRVGIVQTALLVAAVPAMIYAWTRRRRALAINIGFAVLVGLALLWLFTGWSDAAWRYFAPILGRVQYRTRLMGLQALAAAAAGGLVVALAPPRRQRELALGLAALLILAALPSLYINLRHHYAPFDTSITWDEVRDTEIRMGGKSLTAYAEFTPRWSEMEFDRHLLADLTSRFDPQARPLAHPPAGLQVRDAQVESSSWDLQVSAAKPVTATLHLLYYPRWQARIDNVPVRLTAEPVSGYTELFVPPGDHQISLRYAGTPVETAGFVVSGLTLAGLLGLPLVSRGRLWRRQPMKSDDEPRVIVDGAPPPQWLLLGLTVLLVFKIAYVDEYTTWMRCVSTVDRVCDAQHTVSIPFAGGTRLRGYSISAAQARRGATVRVGMFWQGDYTMTHGQYGFLRLRNSQKEQAVNPVTGNDIWVDEVHHGPGGFFNTSYLPGRIYAEEYAVRIPENMAPGSYWLEVGWLDVVDGAQIDLAAEAVHPPLRVLWHSLLLPPIEVQ